MSRCRQQNEVDGDVVGVLKIGYLRGCSGAVYALFLLLCRYDLLYLFISLSLSDTDLPRGFGCSSANPSFCL